MKKYARHYTLCNMFVKFGWHWALTSQLASRRHAWELNRAGEVAVSPAIHVLDRLKGADKLAMAFSITPKGIDIIAKYFFDSKTKANLNALFYNMFLGRTGIDLVNDLFKRQLKYRNYY